MFGEDTFQIVTITHGKFIKIIKVCWSLIHFMHLINTRNMEHIKFVTRTFLYGLFGRGNILFNKVYSVLHAIRVSLDYKKNTTYFTIQILRDIL